MVNHSIAMKSNGDKAFCTHYSWYHFFLHLMRVKYCILSSEVCSLDYHAVLWLVLAGLLVLDIFRAPIQIIVGLLYGVVFGILLWLLPTKHFVSWKEFLSCEG